MGISQGKISVFIQGILFQVQPGAVNMRADNVHPFRQRVLSDHKSQHGFSHLVQIDFIPGLQRFLCNDRLLQADIPGLFQRGNRNLSAFPLRFPAIEKIFVFGGHRFQFLQFCFIVGFPCIGSFHFVSRSLCPILP